MSELKWHNVNDMNIFACISKVDKKEGLWIAIADPVMGDSFSFPIAHLLRDYIDSNVERVDGEMLADVAFLKMKIDKAFDVDLKIA